MYQSTLAELKRIQPLRHFGKVRSMVGTILEVEGLTHQATIGGRCIIHSRKRHDISGIPAEIVGFKGDMALVMPFGTLEGVGPQCRVDYVASDLELYPHDSWLGRVIDAEGNPIDGKPPPLLGSQGYRVKGVPPPAHKRGPVGTRLDMGIRVINSFITCCRGQRVGIFAGSGVGKSVLLSQLAKYTAADIVIIGLIGERGREVGEFITHNLGPEGLKKCVVVVSTSDEPALMRRQAAYVTLTMAEYFRDQGKDVLCLMDTVTRFAMAMREIGLSAGEPPATKGYTPSVFAELPKLLERAGPGLKGNTGNITGLFTVLVEGDDHNEPISDAVRGILDGHIVLERSIGERGRYPAINVLRSLSRMMPDCNPKEEMLFVNHAKSLLALYEDMAEMIRLGAYRKGSSKEVDEAIKYYPALENFLKQGKYERSTMEEGYAELKHILADFSEDNA